MPGAAIMAQKIALSGTIDLLRLLNVGNRSPGIPNRPSGIVKIGVCHSWV